MSKTVSKPTDSLPANAKCWACSQPLHVSPSRLSRRNFCGKACYANKPWDAESFWKKVVKEGHPNGCWTWLGHHVEGYGCCRGYKRKTYPVHRLVWVLLRGPVADDIEVCHNCPGGDNPACCNPDHMFLGTRGDNVRDAVKKGTHVRGEQCHRSKLTPEQVAEIRATFVLNDLEFGSAALGRKYGVAHGSILAIVNGNSWKHIP